LFSPSLNIWTLRGSTTEKSPTARLLLGLILTLAAVLAYSAYIRFEIARLRTLQTELTDRNRKDSLQLLRIQNDLNSLALAMRDMLDAADPYPLTAWSAQFHRIQADLDDAMRLEEQLDVGRRTPEQTEYLRKSVAQFWNAADRTFEIASKGEESEARAQIRLSLQARQAALSTAVSRLLVESNESQQRADEQIAGIYNGVERQVYLFLSATLIAILATSLYLIRSNRRLFARLSDLSEQRSELAQKLISTQESTLRYISRELHDEFGQVLTAIGALLTRSASQIPRGSNLRTELNEIADIAQGALDKTRGLSQALHPVVIDESGLEAAMEGYIPVVERQLGIEISYEKQGSPFSIDATAAIHMYRTLQEAFNNIARHSGAKQAWVRLRQDERELTLEIEDHGVGFPASSVRRGIGLVGMRERAELLGGRLEFLQPPAGGTLVRLVVPLKKTDVSSNEETIGSVSR
jgi:signal transduction histidine kinase